jgi:hypothetical protein
MLKIGCAMSLFHNVGEVGDLLRHTQESIIIDSDDILPQRLGWHCELVLDMSSRL